MLIINKPVEEELLGAFLLRTVAADKILAIEAFLLYTLNFLRYFHFCTAGSGIGLLFRPGRPGRAFYRLSDLAGFDILFK